MSKLVKVVKPGTHKNQLVEPDRVDFYRQFGWVPEEPVRAVLKPAKLKKTVSPEPAVEEEVGNDTLDKGEVL